MTGAPSGLTFKNNQVARQFFSTRAMGSSPRTLLASRQTHLHALADSASNEDHAAGDEGDDDREAAAHTESRDERDGLQNINE